jgi:hypothetical protein
MSRAFSIPTVLRMVPNCLLKEFFQRLGHGDLGVAWERLGEREIEPIVQALNALAPAQFDNVEAALHNVFDLACETGIAAIIEAGVLAGDPDLPAAMPQEGGPYHKAMWAWLNRAEVVNRAVLTLSRLERPTCHLERNGDAVWKGQWLEHERMPVEFIPLEG